MSKKFTYNMVKSYIESYGYKLITCEDEYVNSTCKIELMCPNDHLYKTTFNSFKNSKSRCPYCGTKRNAKFTQQEVEDYLNEHGYELLSIYKNANTPIKVKCPKGHIHPVKFSNFKNGNRCYTCYRSQLKNKPLKYTRKDVCEYMKKYGYELLSNDFLGVKHKLKIQCPNNHIYYANFDNFLGGCRCPKCNESKGERKIKSYLQSKNINFIQQYKIDNCKCHDALPFDFYLPDYNICIEYDGEQHFQPIKHFGGMNGFIDRKIRDTIKNVYCKNNNIRLIRIPYWEINNIKIILKQVDTENDNI